MALTLTVTMMPAAAFASEGSDRAEAVSETSEVINQTHPVEDAGADVAAEAAGVPVSEAVAGSNASSAGEQASVSEQAAGESSARSMQASDQVTASVPAASGTAHVERVSGTVKLEQQAANVATFINYAGLTYAIDPDDDTQVVLVGWASEPSGTLSIPSEIGYNGESRFVTGIVRGGVQCNNLW